MPGLPALTRQRQEDQRFKAGHCYVRPCFKINKQERFLKERRKEGKKRKKKTQLVLKFEGR